MVWREPPEREPETRRQNDIARFCFMHAQTTYYKDELLSSFNNPPALWAEDFLILGQRRNQMITGKVRFQRIRTRVSRFTKYNCDSALLAIWKRDSPREMAKHLVANGRRMVQLGTDDGTGFEAWKNSDRERRDSHHQRHSTLKKTSRFFSMKRTMEKARLIGKLIKVSPTYVGNEEGECGRMPIGVKIPLGMEDPGHGTALDHSCRMWWWRRQRIGIHQTDTRAVNRAHR